MGNPFDEWQKELDFFENEVRRKRAEHHEERDRLAVSLLKEGYKIKDILSWVGTKSPNWLYDACARTGEGTPAQIRARALDDPSRTSLKVSRVPGGFHVVSPGTDEEVTFIWEPEAGAYGPVEPRVSRGTELHDVLKRFGRGLLPFPYTE